MAFKSSISQNLETKNRGGTEQKKKLKKIRSIKLPKKTTLQFDRSTVDAMKEISQGGSESEDTSVKSSPSIMSSPNWDSANGGIERKKTLKKCRSNKLTRFGSFRPSRRNAKSRFDRPSIVSPVDQQQSLVNASDESPNNVKASDHLSLHPSQSSSASFGQKSMRNLSRTTSLRSVRILKSKASFKSKRPSRKNCSEMSENLSVERATCSSTLKDSKFSKEVGLHLGEAESERISVMKVCPYHHCSLHGHSHPPVPPPNRTLYKKRNLMKTQKGKKQPESLSALAVKISGDKKEEFQTNQMVSDAVEIYAKEGAESFRGASQENEDTDVGGKSDSDKSFQENLKQTRNFPEHKETSSECCYTKTQLGKSISETVDRGLNGEEIVACNLVEGDNISTFTGAANDFGDATEDNASISSSSKCLPFGEFNVTNEEKNVNSEPDSKFINGSTPVPDSEPEGFSPVADSEAHATAHEALTPRFKKSNHLSMWHLIHQQMVSGLAAESGTQSLQRADEEKQVYDDSAADTGSENHDTASQEVELRKVFAIKLVREAIEKILLPEVQDQSSDDRSITSDAISDQDLLEKNDAEGGEQSIFTSKECEDNKVGDDIIVDRKEASLEDNNTSVPEEEKTARKEGKESDKKTPKSWSYLKKVILLKRFVKELEKVRKFNPRKPQHLPLEAGPEAEKVSLRRQITAEKKSSEEWMLDYAIRQVVSQLAPTQKRKVALLVKAFETVVPPQDDQHIQVTVSKLNDSSKKCRGIENELDESVSEAHDRDSKDKEILESNLDHGQANSRIAYKQSDVSQLCMPKIKDSNDDIVSNSCEKVPVAVDEKSQQVHGDMISSLNSKLHNGGSESSGELVEIDNLCYATVETSNITNSSATDGDIKSNATANIVSTSDFEPLERLLAAGEEKNRESKPEHVVLREFPPVIRSISDCTANGGEKKELEKENHIKMWHMVYQHVVSGIAAKVGTQLLLDGSDEESAQVEDANKFPKIKASESCQDYFPTDYDTDKENHDATHQRIEFSRSDAVKLVQDAVDEILHPDIQDDSSDTQSIASDDGWELSRLNSTDSGKDSFRKCDSSQVESGVQLDQEQKGSAVNNISTPKDEILASMVRKRSEQQKPKNWSKLKKLILLKRSIKALENVRKLNPQVPQQLPLRRDPEVEKVDLRHQMMEERKKAEQWMLDYAVQHIVTKLTPARKRRVAMLVEAFEAVVPLPEI